MLEPCVLCSGIDLLCESQLLDACQPLEVRVADNIEQQSPRHLDESEHRIVDYLRIFHLARVVIIVVMFWKFHS